MSSRSPNPPPPRMLPPITEVDRAFWSGGADGQLLIQRCKACRRWAHPPVSACPSCGDAVTPEPVSGQGTVFTFTVNHHAYHPAVPVPYVIALVELDEQAGLRLATNLVNCDPEQARVGMRVRVLFEQHDGAFVPLFEPAADEG